MKQKNNAVNGTTTPSFTAASERQTFDGLLFDLDGTIIDSTDAIVKHWHKIGKEIGVDPDVILRDSHGRRSIDTLQLYDPSKANWEYICEMEGRIPFEYGPDAVILPGAEALLEQLRNSNSTWTIVTSGTRPLCEGWLTVMKLAQPVVPFVVAEDVAKGKPDPTCYLLGRSRLNVSKEGKCVVFEDSPAGVEAGKAAGFKVIAVATTHDVKRLQERGADWIVKDLKSVRLVKRDEKTGQMTLEISNALEDKVSKKTAPKKESVKKNGLKSETSPLRRSSRKIKKPDAFTPPMAEKRRRAATVKRVANALRA